MSEQVIRIKRGIVVHIHGGGLRVHDDVDIDGGGNIDLEKRKATTMQEAFILGALRAKRRKRLYEGRDAKGNGQSLGRHRWQHRVGASADKPQRRRSHIGRIGGRWLRPCDHADRC